MPCPAGPRSERGAEPMKTKPAGFLTKLVVFALLVVTASALLNLRTQILSAQAERDALQAERDAQLQINADLQDAVDNSDDPDRQADMARTKWQINSPKRPYLSIQPKKHLHIPQILDENQVIYLLFSILEHLRQIPCKAS